VDGLSDILLDRICRPTTRWRCRDEFIDTTLLIEELRGELGAPVQAHGATKLGLVMPNLAFADSAVVAGGFIGRATVLAQIASWLRTDRSGVLAVTGGPGSGKTALLRRIAALTAHVDAAGRTELPAADNDQADDEPVGPLGGAVTVAVDARNKALTQVLHEVTRGIGCRPDAGQDELITAATAALHPTVMVDGVDEAAAGEGVAIAMLVRDLADAGCRVVIGTGAGVVLRTLGKVNRVELDDPKLVTEHYADVTAYLAARLGDPATARALAYRVGGNFLYASLVAQLLTRSDTFGKWRDRVPVFDSAAAFSTAVEADLSQLPADLHNRTRTMLAALSWAEGVGLPRHPVWPAVAEALAGTRFGDTDVAATLEHAAWYISEEVHGGQVVYRLSHAKLVDHFREVSRREF